MKSVYVIFFVSISLDVGFWEQAIHFHILLVLQGNMPT